MPRRTLDEFSSVMELIHAGRGDAQIQRLTGVPRKTVSAWRHGRGVVRHRRQARAGSSWRPTDAPRYCYLLGAYLGDGHVVVTSLRSATLVLSLDAIYPAIVDEVAGAMQAVFPDATPRRFHRMRGSVAVLQICHPAIPRAFPQHGAGKKHLRPIRLVPWQEEFTARHPQALLRGLVHSDGARVINRFKTSLPSGRVAEYAYPRYFFSNLSRDIRKIFCDHCDLLGIRWTQSNPRNISIAHREGVAILDGFIGPKA